MPLAPEVVAVARPLLRGRRFPLLELRGGWRAVVGDRLAAVTAPERLAMPAFKGDGGTLTLKVAGGAAALQVQHQTPLVIERCNTFLGWPAVARLKLVQAPFAAPDAAADSGSATAGAFDEAATPLPQEIAGIADERLRAVLIRLARRAHP